MTHSFLQFFAEFAHIFCDRYEVIDLIITRKNENFLTFHDVLDATVDNRSFVFFLSFLKILLLFVKSLNHVKNFLSFK